MHKQSGTTQMRVSQNINRHKDTACTFITVDVISLRWAVCIVHLHNAHLCWLSFFPCKER